MLFAALLIAAVCAEQKPFTFDLTKQTEATTKILLEAETLELLYQRNHDKVDKDYIAKTVTDLGVSVKNQDKLEGKTVADVKEFAADVSATKDVFAEAHQEKAKVLFKDFLTPAGDWNCQIVSDERLCGLQAKHFKDTFANYFKKDKWAAIGKLDEKALTAFKAGITLGEDKDGTKWKKITETDATGTELQKYAEAACKIEAFREHFKAEHKDHSSVAAFGMASILAVMALAF